MKKGRHALISQHPGVQHVCFPANTGSQIGIDNGRSATKAMNYGVMIGAGGFNTIVQVRGDIFIQILAKNFVNKIPRPNQRRPKAGKIFFTTKYFFMNTNEDTNLDKLGMSIYTNAIR